MESGEIKAHLKVRHKERTRRAEELIEDRFDELECDASETAKELFGDGAFVGKKNRRFHLPQGTGEVHMYIRTIVRMCVMYYSSSYHFLYAYLHVRVSCRIGMYVLWVSLNSHSGTCDTAT